MPRVKYVCTKDNQIIVFSELFTHDEFKNFDPISAGFISIGAEGRHEPKCSCHGESVSLKLKSRPEEDTELARKQILGNDY
jgi:hypothetical protein